MARLTVEQADRLAQERPPYPPPSDVPAEQCPGPTKWHRPQPEDWNRGNRESTCTWCGAPIGRNFCDPVWRSAPSMTRPIRSGQETFVSQLADAVSMTEGKLVRGANLNVDNAAGARLLTVGRRPDGVIVLVARGRLDFPGGNTVLLSAEDAAVLADYLTGKESGDG